MDGSMIGGLIGFVGGSLIFATILFVAVTSQFSGDSH